MSELIDFYVQQATEHLSGVPWLAKLQRVAISDLQRLGLPTKQCEDWKYTPIDLFCKYRFQSPRLSEVAQLAGGPQEISIDITNGQYIENVDLAAILPVGVMIKPLSVMIKEHEDLIQPHLNQILSVEHGFHALNSAMLEKGMVIYLPKGTCLSKPIFLNHWQSNDSQAVHQRHVIIAEPESEVTVIETYAGEDNTAYFTNTVTEVVLGAGAKLTHYKLQQEGNAAMHVGHMMVKQDKLSELSSHSFSFGGRWVRSDLTISLQQNEATCLLNGVYIGDDKQQVDHHTRVNHLVANCISDQDYKGILKGQSRAVFNGQVCVAHDAQQTRANQQNKNILLSAEAEINTKPQLEIDADDVICSHGATVGQMDEDAKFYLSSRGMEEELVTRYLIQAFIAQNRQLIPDAALREQIMQLINDKLKDNHESN